MPLRYFWSTALIAVTAVWGWSFVAKHQLLETTSPSALNAWLFMLAALSLLPFSKRSFKVMKRSQWHGSMGAGAVLFIAFSMQTAGTALTTPSNAGFITGLCTIFTPLIVYIRGGRRPATRQLAGTLVALVGLGLLSFNGFALHRGDLLILGCAMCFALHIVVVSSFSTIGASMASTTVQMAVVGILSMTWSFAYGEVSAPPTPVELLMIILLALLATALAFAIQNYAQAILPPETVALILICEPLFSGIFGYLLVGDRLTSSGLAGAVLILIGLVITEFRFSRRCRQTSERS